MFRPLVRDGTYRIMSTINNTYLTQDANGVVAQQSNSNASQWAISAGRDGDYEIKSSTDNQLLHINDLNQLVYSASGPRITWTIEPRGPNAYVIGNAADTLAIQLPTHGPVMVAMRNNSAGQRWSLEPNPVSVSSGGSSDRNTLFAGVFAVSGFTWNIQANLRSIDDLPVATQMMARGPHGSYSPTQVDFEAFQVARWALDCFVQSAVPITHPGGRGNYDALRDIYLGGSGCIGWVSSYVYQRLLDIAILHPATRAVPIVHPFGAPGDIPSALQMGTSSWNIANRILFSFCFRLHQALVQAGAIVTGSLSGITVKSVHNFSWYLPPRYRSLDLGLLEDTPSFIMARGPRYRSLDLDLPEGTRIMARGPSGSLDIDFEAYQVARWALCCFEQHAIPITHPGGRGNYDAMPDSIRLPRQQSWPCAYICQRLLDIAALHPQGRQVAISGNIDGLDVAEPTRAAVSTWTEWNQRLFSLCFRLHRALLDPSPILPSPNRPLAIPFEWNIQPDLSMITDLPRATISIAQGGQSQRDLEAFQVARWAIALFSSHGIPITNPGGRGIWDALPSYRRPDDGWAYAHLLQRLLEVAALHPAGHQVPVDTDDWNRDIPPEIREAVSNWGGGTRNALSAARGSDPTSYYLPSTSLSSHSTRPTSPTDYDTHTEEDLLLFSFESAEE